MKFLLLGANGQVGHELRRSLAPLGEVICTTRSGRLPDGAACEIADFDRPDTLAPLVGRLSPDVVVNAAAYTAVDRAETEPEAAYHANAEAPASLAQACASCGALLVHYSTDYVFDGTRTRPYREDDPTSPLGVYGASKLAGEQAIRNSGARHLIFRTAWVYASHGRNFMRTMLRLAGERDELRVVADQVGTPTSATLIADVTAQILGQPFRESGLWHLTATGQTSWHGFAEAIVGQAHERGLIARMPTIVPITTAEYPTLAKRPVYSCLDTSRLREGFAIDLSPWEQSLRRVLRDIH
ncbi:dTDP-4-dehydrorhamnose reductase [Pseudoxanthomonas kalamensis DSM 18571]|uniref:dTDP-4-dehydrorhamnose reductase n=1 Tax=Pseudoxanthomonas kalamensis TaxID=289483 RepID=UPI001390E20F|nr:dTDP-4-dehydrorhamnose reductase [Pseudoxanthomonas kalamensis]KAF1709298.1 dTDP-4-dehydrorhamnose reductase [Pseudoxanthomonas kalamensis DSM 18571]